MSLRSSSVLPWVEGLLYDLRFTARALRRDQAFTVAATAMLALAIALNVTVFTVMDAMLFRGYPQVKRNDRLVYLQEQTAAGVGGGLSYPDFEDWRAQAHAFEAIAFIGEKRISFRDGNGRPTELFTFTVSTNTFRLLGVAPMLGRDFVPADESPGAAPVVILNYRFWESRFGKQSAIVGSTIHVDGAPAIIIGVMPERFDFPTQENLWMPLAHTPELQRRGLTPGAYIAVARLRDRVSPKEARAEVETINRRLQAAFPSTNRGLVPSVVDNLHWRAGPNGPVIYSTLWAGGWFVLLIACANLANLTLVRNMRRWREFSTRMALGAGLGRMVRQIFVESLALATVAGALGWWITEWSVRRWAMATASRYQILDYTVDSGTLAYLVGISVAAAILFSVPPVAKMMQLGISGALNGNIRGITRDPRGKHFGSILVAGQMALAIVLLSGAGVLVRSFVKIVRAEREYATRNTS